mmetsp:Transcript_48947/g.81323  ORF Transcript_48947/g.81323 Transcript_48947/m.81323 type:complete len:279 (-) Transcript_48947:225-1061(-)|eukprot:CAMPEP_0119346666 /NCGR_PEP_ID=MMETSP1333-20130426/108122_1 /TAXON_ID=418940 /ORGANISM="Scyphosphaera apsteinii, Strain RCC1455" /LENGTH=278 /DNA_ID=CAMNT_0007359177 /DNA_START=51 /DNA_END=887 /DNA_ORIENTATION=+
MVVWVGRCPVGTHTLEVGDLSARTDSGTSRTNILPSQSVLSYFIASEEWIANGEIPPQFAEYSKCPPSTFEINRPCYLVDLRGEPVKKENTFEMMTMGAHDPDRKDTFYLIKDDRWQNYDTYLHTFTVGELAQLEVWGSIDFHPLHMHVNPYQINTDLSLVSMGGWFKEGDWHDTLLLSHPGTDVIGGCGDKVWHNSQPNPWCFFPWNKTILKFQADKYTGPAIVHCHILRHEDRGMMGTFKLNGVEGSKWPGARRIDPTCYFDANDAKPAKIVETSC